MGILNNFILIPLLGLLISLLWKRNNEKAISITAILTLLMQLLVFPVLVYKWWLTDEKWMSLFDFSLYSSGDYSFNFGLYFDKVSAIFSFLGIILSLLVVFYTSKYLHREPGFKRFFNTIQLFFVGYNFVVFGGNYETIFIGWEILGISSFLLIAFYRERYLPVKNAVKVFFIYRIGDVGFILAMWLSHHAWHSNINFANLNQLDFVQDHLRESAGVGIAVGLLFFLVAMGKSALFPFSSWLPRAMEGPTPSSAIFYGSLSVHLGAFLMLRSLPIVLEEPVVQVVMISVGLITTFVGHYTAKYQSTIKSQVAYGSLSQIGLIFIEIALGWVNIALLHFVGNALLRTYQLLVSPSSVVYLIRKQHRSQLPEKHHSKLLSRWNFTMYVLSLKEFYMEQIQYRLLWYPFKQSGRLLNKVDKRFFLGLGLFLTILFGLNFVGMTNHFPNWWLFINQQFSLILALFALSLVLFAFGNYKNSLFSWIAIALSHWFIALSVLHKSNSFLLDVEIYLSGIFVAFIMGIIVLKYIQKHHKIQLNHHWGLFQFYPKLSVLFLVVSLMMTGFPITPTFLGEDLMFTHLQESEPILAAIIALTLIIDGLVIVRMYSRLFFVITRDENNRNKFYKNA